MISCLMWNIYLYFIILKLFTNFQNIIFFVKIVANASLSKSNLDLSMINSECQDLFKRKLFVGNYVAISKLFFFASHGKINV
jgi:hypothetical protein